MSNRHRTKDALFYNSSGDLQCPLTLRRCMYEDYLFLLRISHEIR